MKRVLYIAHESNLVGGASQSLYELLKVLSNRLSLFVVTPGSGTLKDELDMLHIKNYVVPMNRGYGGIETNKIENWQLDFLRNYKAAIRIKDIIIKEKIDIVHINSSICNAGAMGAIMSNVPFVWHIREIMRLQLNEDYWDSDLKAQLFESADTVIAISSCVKEFFEARYGFETKMIYNYICPERYFANIEVKSNNKKFILLGGISETKGQLDAVKAVKELYDLGYKDIELYLIGMHSYRSRWCLQRFIDSNHLQKNIFLYDHMNDLAEVRKSCAYQLVTSKYEALGRVTVEAMYAGNIIIGADTGETKVLIGNNERGILYQQGDASSLANAIRTALDICDERKKKILLDAQKFAIDNFSKEKYITELDKIYENVIKNYVLQKEIRQKLDDRYNDLINKSNYNIFGDQKLARKEVMNAIEKEWNKRESIVDSKIKATDRKVAIYGMSKLGCRLYDTFEKLGKNIAYVIDKNLYFLDLVIEAYSPSDELKPVDEIIIATVDKNEEIKKYLLNKTKAKVLYLNEFLEIKK